MTPSKIKIRNPHDVPVEVPRYGILSAGAEVELDPHDQVTAAIDAGRIERVGKSSPKDKGGK